MPKYRIYFLGLICHVGQLPDEKRYAALVHDGHHWMACVTDRGCTGISPGQHIRFSEREGDAHARRFSTYVPSLSATMGGQLALSVTNPSGPLAAYVHFPDRAELDVAEVFLEKARHTSKRGKREGCVARMSVLNIDIEGGLTMTVDGSPVDIGRDRTVLIANVSRHTDEYDNIQNFCKNLPLNVIHGERNKPARDAEAKEHFKKFGHIVNSEEEVDIEVLTDQPCKPIGDYPRWIGDILLPAPNKSGTNVGCGNTNWP